MVVAQLLNETVNTAPELVFDPQRQTVVENTAGLNIQLKYTDAENDTGTFHLESLPQRGSVSVTSSGQLMYTPCKDCIGFDSIGVRFVENLATSPLSATGRLEVEVVNVNDPPGIFFFNGTRGLYSEGEILTYAAANSTSAQLVVRAGLFDVDGYNDVVNLIVTQPRHGTATITLDVEAVGSPLSMPVDWPAKHTMATFSGDIVFTTANISYQAHSPDFTGTDEFLVSFQMCVGKRLFILLAPVMGQAPFAGHSL